MKSGAELCVIREKSVLIPVNRQFSILIPVSRARPSSPPPLLSNPVSDPVKVRKEIIGDNIAHHPSIPYITYMWAPVCVCIYGYFLEFNNFRKETY